MALATRYLRSSSTASFFIALFGILRSPRWLVMQRRTDEALNVLRLIGTRDASAELDEIVASVHLELGAQPDRLFSRKYAKPIFLARYSWYVLPALWH